MNFRSIELGASTLVSVCKTCEERPFEAETNEELTERNEFLTGDEYRDYAFVGGTLRVAWRCLRSLPDVPAPRFKKASGFPLGVLKLSSTASAFT